MGSSQSKSESDSDSDAYCQSLDCMSVEDIQSFVTNLGDKYKSYGEAVVANAVDGELLMEIEDTDDFKAMLECLEITNFVHQRVLIKEWKKFRASSLTSVRVRDKPQTMPTLQRKETLETMTDASEITLDTALSTLHTSTSRASLSSSASAGLELPLPPVPPLSITLDHKHLLEPLQYSKDTTVLPADSPILEPYRQVTTQIIADLKGDIAQVNLLDVDMPPGTDQKGVNNLATAPFQTRLNFDQPQDAEICRRFILQHDQDFHVEDIPSHVTAAFGMKESAKYYGHVVQYGNLRVGTVCTVIQETPGNTTTLKQKQEILAFLANIVQEQLSKRQALLQRAHNLKADLQHLHHERVDPVLAPSFGPIRPVTASQVSSRETLFPYPQHPNPTSLMGPNGCPSPPFQRRSATLPMFQHHLQATPRERYHLHPTIIDSINTTHLDPIPVSKTDLQRVALLHSLQILQITPECEEAKNVQSLVQMVAQLLPVDVVFVNFIDHQNCNIFFTTFLKEWPEMQSIFDTHPVVQYDYQTKKPFHLQPTRARGICNYAIATPNHQSFVVHDVAQDQSLCFFHQETTIGFYSGAPIVIRGENLGVLACLRKKPCTSFGQVQELQQEQFAQLIAQQYEMWALNREVQQLERERNLFCQSTTDHIAPSSTVEAQVILPPQEYAALVFASVASANSLRESNEFAMEHAMTLHNRILQSEIVRHRGYLVQVEDRGAVCQVSFSDVVDAVKFCLRTQEVLQDAPWRSDLLALPQAKDDGSIRGLRVKMAIHCGPVDTSTNTRSNEETSGIGEVRCQYSGETYHIAKSLETMGHGGQILITSDVWNVASPLLKSDRPQVVDLGAHVMPTHSRDFHDGVTTKKVIQLVPTSLAHDYRQSRSRENVVPGEKVCDIMRLGGRMFPRIKTKKSVGSSFHDAPFVDYRVCLVSVNTSHLESMTSDPGLLLAALSKHIGAILKDQQPDGYQCEDFLVAFEECGTAIRFGLALQKSLSKEKILDLWLEGLVKVGVYEGIFDTMGPNATTGRAEYVGVVGDHVRRIAGSAALGSVYMGKIAEEMDMFNLQPIANGFMLSYCERRSFHGLEEEFSLYRCQPCKSWYDQMLDQRNGRSSLQNRWRERGGVCGAYGL